VVSPGVPLGGGRLFCADLVRHTSRLAGGLVLSAVTVACATPGATSTAPALFSKTAARWSLTGFQYLAGTYDQRQIIERLDRLEQKIDRLIHPIGDYMAVLPTVEIVSPDDPKKRWIINQRDYRADQHTLWTDKETAPEAPPETTPTEDAEEEAPDPAPAAAVASPPPADPREVKTKGRRGRSAKKSSPSETTPPWVEPDSPAANESAEAAADAR